MVVERETLTSCWLPDDSHMGSVLECFVLLGINVVTHLAVADRSNISTAGSAGS